MAFEIKFGNAPETMEEGVRTHAVAGAPYSLSAGLSPVLIFSPGGGMVREVYAAQLEDLASHGYVVAAISHPYDAIVTIFPDGRQIAYSSQRWPKPPSLEGEANLNQLEWHANDIRFVLDELSRANVTGPTAWPFAGHLDLDHVGAFGHSFGGIAAAHACQIDRRLKACLDEDGVVAKKPFYLDARGWGLDQSFMLILRDPPTRRLSDAEVAQMKMSRQRLEQIMTRIDTYQETALRSTGKGSYRVRLRNNITTHMDFSDLPVLGARDRVDAERRAAILAVVRSYTLAFFDRYLRGMKAELLDEPVTSEFVEAVQKFAPTKSPCASQ
jgi:pimeloyl-ACP methyl ester carboxylesterase